MKVRLSKRTVKPEGCPISLRIDPVIFTGKDESEIVSKIKRYVADDVIPHIPFTRKDDKYRKQIREMPNSQLVEMLTEYMNAHNKPTDTDYPPPETDSEAIDTFVSMGLLTLLER